MWQTGTDSTTLETAPDRRERFEEHVTPHLGFLARVCRAMSASSSDADDLAQDTLFRAFRAIDGFDGRHPEAWLFRIARNTAISRYERTRERPGVDDDSLERLEAPADASPEVLVVDAQMDERLRGALDRLAPAFRLVVDLVDVEGFSYREAADYLGVPVGTIMSRLHRARAQLRRALTADSKETT